MKPQKAVIFFIGIYCKNLYNHSFIKEYMAKNMVLFIYWYIYALRQGSVVYQMRSL